MPRAVLHLQTRVVHDNLCLFHDHLDLRGYLLPHFVLPYR